MKEENVQYLSGEVREILDTPPSWVATWGTSILAGVVIMLCMVGIFFEYPETVTGDLVLTTAEPPVPVQAQRSAQLAEIKVGENDFVKKDDVLAVFMNSANLEDILDLEKEVEEVSEFDLSALQTFKPKHHLRLGEIAPAYSSFVNVIEYMPFIENDQMDQSAIYALSRQIQQMQKSISTMEQKKNTTGAELTAHRQKFNSTRNEYAENGDENLSSQIYDINLQVSAKLNELKGIDTEIDKKREEILTKRARILEMQLQQQAGAKERIYQLTESLINLKTEIKRWKNDYLILAPSDGNVLFFDGLESGRKLETGEDIFSIVPPGSNDRYIGKVQLPIQGSGKVRDNQEVNIKLARYPFREFGQLKGKVSKIYPVAKGNSYSVVVELQEGLKTTLGRELDFHQQMIGKAEIVTEKRKFIARIFEKLLPRQDDEI
jgi:multidrug efflux pump subunit AcrA (membrane-fusion protein)